MVADSLDKKTCSTRKAPSVMTKVYVAYHVHMTLLWLSGCVQHLNPEQVMQVGITHSVGI